MRTIDWVGDGIEIIDQTALPIDVRILRITTVDDLMAANARLATRPAFDISVDALRLAV